MSVTTLPSKNHHHQKMGDELSHLLASSYSLYLKTQNFHWNVTGMNFQSLHLMFEEQYKQLAEAIDVIAERIRALKCKVHASFSHFIKLSALKEENGSPNSKDMIKQLLKDHESIVMQTYTILTKAAKAQDEATMDLLVERVREHEKTAWMLRSCLE
jgi:starvation-inducible DNA-binding protein